MDGCRIARVQTRVGHGHDFPLAGIWQVFRRRIQGVGHDAGGDIVAKLFDLERLNRPHPVRCSQRFQAAVELTRILGESDRQSLGRSGGFYPGGNRRPGTNRKT